MTRRKLMLLFTASVAVAISARPVKGARYKAQRVRGSVRESKLAESTPENGPVVFELTAEERWPIRGLDPVLHVGGVVIDSYRFGNAENTVLIFTCYQPEALKEGAYVHLQYGGDETSRTDLPNFRWNNVQ
jgi:hypothetical protein